MERVLSSYEYFWRHHPAFLYGIHFFLGLSSIRFSSSFLLIAWIFLLFTHSYSQYQVRISKLLLPLILFLLGAAYGCFSMPPVREGEVKIEGSALFSPSSIKLYLSPFHKSYVYRGTLLYFEGKEGQVLQRLPCSIYLPLSSQRPKADGAYYLEGSLTKSDLGSYIFKPFSYSRWLKEENTFSFAEWRFIAKEKLHSYLTKHIPDRKVTSFLFTLSTGDMDEKMLSFEFSKIGLQHILAISGFHFALLALFLGGVLKKLFPAKPALLVLLILLSAYFFFIGSSPSVMRAWVAIFIWILADLLGKRTTALNALGAALLIELIYDPSSVDQLGFQLSFLSTAALLLIVPTVRPWLERLLPKRPKEELIHFSRMDKAGYLACAFLRQALTINVAVHLVSIPVCLYHFHKFPWLSLGYNLFFPYWTGISLLFFLTICPMALFFPTLGEHLYTIHTHFTRCLLDITSSPPALLDHSFHVETVPKLLVILYLFLLFHISVLHRSKKTIG